MAYTSVNTGTLANDGSGDPIRTAFDKVNTGILSLDSQSYFNTRLFQSNAFTSNTFTVNFANITQRLHSNVFSANTFSAGNLTIDGNITAGNVIVPPGGKYYGTFAGAVSVASLEDVPIGIATPREAKFTTLIATHWANIANSTVSTSTTNGAFVVGGGAGIGGNLNIGGNIIASGNANVANLAVSGQVNSDLYFYGKTVYVDGSPVQTAAQSFSGGNVANPTRFLSTTQSTSGATGAVRLEGGLGVLGNVNTNQNLGVVGRANVGHLTATSNVTVGTASNVGLFGNGSISGTIITASQPNINTIGSLTALGMAGNITAGSSNQFAIGDGSAPFLETYSFRVISTFIQGTLTTGVQTGITTVGTLGNLAVTSNITAGNVSATQGSFTNVQGTVLTASQPNITTVGNLGNLVVTGNVTGNVVGQVLTASQPNITTVGTLDALAVTGNITSGNVSGTKGTFTNIQGTLVTAIQPNITTVGNLENLTITGNITSTGNLAIKTGANANTAATFHGNGITTFNGNIQVNGSVTSTIGSMNMRVFTSNSTFTVPAGVTTVKATVVGGGGGSVGGVGPAGSNGAGAGGCAIKIVSGLTPGANVTVTVGAGGTIGGTGGTSSFGTHCSATGGASGGTGGIGSNGDLNFAGGPGGFGATSYGAAGGSSYFGGGGTAYAAGRAYGGGAGGGGEGGESSYSGYAGAAGVVLVEW
jgi:hypothetical protein